MRSTGVGSPKIPSTSPSPPHLPLRAYTPCPCGALSGRQRSARSLCDTVLYHLCLLFPQTLPLPLLTNYTWGLPWSVCDAWHRAHTPDVSKDIPNRLKIHQPKKPLTSPFSFRILLLKSLPSRHRKSSPGCKIPHLVAIARAVLILSPVTIRTVIPALWHFFIASGTWFTRTQFTLGKKISTAERGEIPLSKHTLPRSCTNDNCMSSPDTISWRAPNNLFFPLPLPLPYFRLQSQFSSDLTGRHYFFAKGLGKRLPPVDHQAILSWLAFYPSGSTAQTRPE